MSLAQLFFMKETFRERVRHWRQACFRRRLTPSIGSDSALAKRVASRFTLEALEPRLLLSGTPVSLDANFFSEVPNGSLIHINGDTTPGNFATEGQIDRYTVNLDSGQKLTTLVLPGDSAQQVTMTVLDPTSASIGTSPPPVPGVPVVLRNLSISTSGLYTIDVSNQAGTGNYDLVAFLNTDLESELIGGPPNNTWDTAQDLAPSSLPLQGTADRLAVLGDKQDGTNDDYYLFDLTVGQVAFVMATPERGGNLHVSLFDSTGTTELARGIATAENVGEVIPAFKATMAGTYYVRVSGTANVDPNPQGPTFGIYDLVVTRGSAFDLEPNSPSAYAQRIGLTKQVLGSVGLQRSNWEDDALGVIRVAVLDAGNAAPLVAQLNDDTFYNFAATAVGQDQINTVKKLANYDVVVIGDPESRTALQSIASTLQSWVESGGAVVGTGGLIQAAGSQGGAPIGNIEAFIPVVTSVLPSSLSNQTVTVLSTSSPVTQGLTTFPLNASLEYSTSGVDGGELLATAGGQAAVVIRGNTGEGRSVWLGPKYFEATSTSLRSGDADQLLEQAVAWAGRSGIDTVDQYIVPVNAEDNLTITTTTPGGGPNVPANTLVPFIQLFKSLSDTAPVATSTGGAPLVHTATTSGPYYVIVTPTSGSGEYTLQVTGATGAIGGAGTLGITSTSPGPGASVTSFPSTYRVQFSAPLLLTTLQASDLTVNGLTATGLNIVDGQTVDFILPLLIGPGPFTVQIPAAALEDIRGATNSLITRQFSVVVPDTTGPTVTEVRVRDSSNVDRALTPTTIIAPGGPVTLTVTFNEDLATSGLDQNDVALSRIDDTYVYPTSGFNILNAHQIEVTYSNLDEDVFQLTLFSGTTAFRDVAGNPLNGSPSFPLPSGQGNPAGDDFVVEFGVASLPQSFVPLETMDPRGSLVYSSNVIGVFDAVNVTTDWTIDLEQGQHLAVGLFPSSGVRGKLEVLFGPNDTPIGPPQEAVNAGDDVVVQELSVATDGTYKFRVTSLAGTGVYELGFLLNSSVDLDFVTGPLSNDTILTAQNLTTASSIPLQGTADRLAVQGDINAIGDVDVYAFQLTAGQATTLVAAGNDPSSPLVTLELLDSTGTVLAVGIDATDDTHRITHFVPTQSGTYYARVSGDAPTGYQLVITRGADLDQEANDALATAQDIREAGQVLGALAQNSRTGGTAIKVAVLGNTGTTTLANQLSDDTFFNFDAVAVTASQIDTVGELNGYDAVVIGDPTSRTLLQQVAVPLQDWVQAGGAVVGTGGLIAAAGFSKGSSIQEINNLFGVSTWGLPLPLSNPTLDVLDAAHGVTQGLSDFSLNGSVEYQANGSVSTYADLLAVANGQAAVVAAQVYGPSSSGDVHGNSVWLGPTYFDSAASGLRSGAADQLLEQAVAWASRVDTADVYRFYANAGDQLVITTTTPFDGPNQPPNSLNPKLELYNPQGQLVASTLVIAPDGRNEQLTYTVPVGPPGLYVARVLSEGGTTGDYTLAVTGASNDPASPAPYVTGSQAVSTSQALTVEWSEGLRLDTVTGSDLLIDGTVTATGVEFPAGNLVRFLLPTLNTQQTHQFQIAAGAVQDLQGNFNQVAREGNFTIDAVSPYVVAQNPPAGIAPPMYQIAFTFNEPLDPASVDQTDIVSFTGPSGIDLLHQQNQQSQVYGISVVNQTVTVFFQQQTALGTYTMVLGPHITDVAGNLMDQNANGTSGEPTDTYTATVQVEVNQPPAGTNKTVTIDEDTSYTFSAADFGFTDTNPGDT